MSLRDLMESDLEDVFLNTEEHAETIAYTAQGNAPQTITAIVDEDGALDDMSGMRVGKGSAAVFVKRADVPNPQTGDTIQFTRNGFAKRLSYSGTFQDADEFGWWLIFTVSKTERISGNVGQ